MKTSSLLNKLYFFIFILLIPSIILPEWLSDKKNAGDLFKLNKHGYLMPIINEKIYPKIGLIESVYLLKKKSVRISWYNQTNKDYRYIIYRSDKRISTLDTFYKAEKVGIVDKTSMKFLDKMTKPGKYYYAVAVLDKNKIEYFKPAYDQTYQSQPVSVIMPPDTVMGILANYDVSTGKIKITWKNPITSGLIYKIYQNNSPITSLIPRKNSKYLGETEPSAGSFSYIPEKDGSFYYCAVSIDPKKVESVDYITNKNITTSALVYKKIAIISQKPKPVSDIKAVYNKTNDIITITWKYSDLQKPGLKIQHNQSFPILFVDTLNSSSIVKNIQPGSGITSYVINKPKSGRHYFAITSYNLSGTQNIDLIPDSNSINEAVNVPFRKITPPITNVIKTNMILKSLTNFSTNIVFKTNTILSTATNFVTNTVFKTNFVNITNISTKFSTNLIHTTATNTVTNTIVKTITNILSFTNTISQTNIYSLTNTVVLTNTVLTTNTGSITNKKDVKIDKDITIDNQTVEKQQIELRNEIRRFYNQKKYHKSIRRFKQLRMKTKDKTVNANCTLFIGRSYFAAGEYRKALSEFIKIRKILPDLTAIWIRRCTQNLY